jgi:hypothetical protein
MPKEKFRMFGVAIDAVEADGGDGDCWVVEG